VTDKEEIKDGVVEEFYDNGQLRNRVTYKNGKLDGFFDLFVDGQLSSRNCWKNDFPEKKSYCKD
jgi:antitoxin component YwqK of YwqJK toxin-antitoxin module